jgi:hypothetical protein
MLRTIAFLLLPLLVCAAHAETDGSRDFVARPKVGAAHLTLPSHLTWQASPDADGTYHVRLSLVVDVGLVLRDIRALSAAALDKAKPCGDLLRVRDAAARLTGATTLGYDLRFHYAKRLCVNGTPMELPADVACSSTIALSAVGSRLIVDIRGANSEPCAIDGTSAGLAKFASSKVFKTHTIDLAQQLPPEFRGATVNVRSIAFDTPPSSPRLRISGDSTMSDQEFREFTSRINSTRR